MVIKKQVCNITNMVSSLFQNQDVNIGKGCQFGSPDSRSKSPRLWVVDFICPPKFHRNFNCTKGIKFLLDIQHMDGNWNVQLSTTWKNYNDNAHTFTRRCSVWSISTAYASDSELLFFFFPTGIFHFCQLYFFLTNITKKKKLRGI